MSFSRWLLAGLVIALAGEPGSTYSQTADQRRTLHEIGRAIAWGRQCSGAQLDMEGVRSALLGVGISLAAFNRDGSPEFEVASSAAQSANEEAAGLSSETRCQKSIAEYGPRGTRLPNLISAVASTGSGDEEPRKFKAVDFLVDGSAVTGRLVVIDSCIIHYARADIVMCAVMNGRQNVGTIYLDGASMSREVLREALNRCADVLPQPRCRAYALAGRVRKNSAGDLFLNQASLSWTK